MSVALVNVRSVLIFLPCFHFMSQNHPTCQRNFLHLKLASPNENLICYYEHSCRLKHCLWAWDLKALNALNLQTNGFQAGRNWMYPLKWRYPAENEIWPFVSSRWHQFSPAWGADGCWGVQHWNTVIPLDNNHGNPIKSKTAFTSHACENWAIFCLTLPQVMGLK